MVHDLLEGEGQYIHMNPRVHCPTKQLKSNFQKHTLHYHEAQTNNGEGSYYHMAFLYKRMQKWSMRRELELEKNAFHSYTKGLTF